MFQMFQTWHVCNRPFADHELFPLKISTQKSYGLRWSYISRWCRRQKRSNQTSVELWGQPGKKHLRKSWTFWEVKLFLDFSESEERGTAEGRSCEGRKVGLLKRVGRDLATWWTQICMSLQAPFLKDIWQKSFDFEIKRFSQSTGW